MEWLQLLQNILDPAALVAAVIAFVKLNSEVKSMKLDNESKALKLSQTYIEDFEKHIKNPLLHKMDSLRDVIKNLKNAIEKINDCPYNNNCPVRDELQKQQRADEDEFTAEQIGGARQQPYDHTTTS